MIWKLNLGKILEWIVKAMAFGLLENVIKFKNKFPKNKSCQITLTSFDSIIKLVHWKFDRQNMARF